MHAMAVGIDNLKAVGGRRPLRFRAWFRIASMSIASPVVDVHVVLISWQQENHHFCVWVFPLWLVIRYKVTASWRLVANSRLSLTLFTFQWPQWGQAHILCMSGSSHQWRPDAEVGTAELYYLHWDPVCCRWDLFCGPVVQPPFRIFSGLQNRGVFCRYLRYFFTGTACRVAFTTRPALYGKRI